MDDINELMRVMNAMKKVGMIAIRLWVGIKLILIFQSNYFTLIIMTEHMNQEVDLNKDGVIDYSEFLTLVKVLLWISLSFKYISTKYYFQGRHLGLGSKRRKAFRQLLKVVAPLTSQNHAIFNTVEQIVKYLHKSFWILHQGSVPFPVFSCYFQDIFHRQETVEFLVPYKYTYQNQYSCSPPPLFMLLVRI